MILTLLTRSVIQLTLTAIDEPYTPAQQTQTWQHTRGRSAPFVFLPEEVGCEH